MQGNRREMRGRGESTFSCVRCRHGLVIETATPGDVRCEACGARVHVDDVAVDILEQPPAPGSWGERAMQSRWLARIYESAWRPLSFGLSTGLGAPSARLESRWAVERLGGTAGPWLDLSCGPGNFTRELVARAEGRAVFGVDLSRPMLERAHRSAPTATLVRADAAALPFEDGSFGAVVNLAALDLYVDAAKVVAECARILAPGGRWVASTFTSADPWLTTARRRSGAGPRKPTAAEVADAVQGAGLVRFGSIRLRRYMLAWADKG